MICAKASNNVDQTCVISDREKLQGVEAKLRSTIQDKANVQSEKANIERQLKALQAQTGKLTKVLVTTAMTAAERCSWTTSWYTMLGSTPSWYSASGNKGSKQLYIIRMSAALHVQQMPELHSKI